jgi:long-chain fatty acid transport protein
MRKILYPAIFITIACSSTTYATNGDTLIGVAPTARSMGGAIVAAPQDAISAIFANPAAICIGPYCPGSQVVAGASLFDATTRAHVTAPGASYSKTSSTKAFIIPAFGVISPITERLRVGFGAYGISGMGTDYRNQNIDLDNNAANGYEGDVYTQSQTMRFAPNVAYLVSPNFSIGASLHIVYGSLDLGQGKSENSTIGGQVGMLYKNGPVSLGINYTTAEKLTYHNVYDFEFNGNKESLVLESPQNVTVGVALRPLDSLLIETDVKWFNWGDAAGYSDFDWQDQWVYSIGVQYKSRNGLSLRAGYNYGKNPVNTHDGFNAATSTKIQGNNTSTLGYEYLRIIGFPGIAEHHATAGIGYRFNEDLEVHLGYSFSSTATIKERDSSGAYSFASSMRENSYEMGLIWNW